MRPDETGLQSSLKSVPYYLDWIPDEAQPLRDFLKARQVRRRSYSHMLSEDLSDHLLPFGHGIDDDFEATLAGASPDNERRYAEALPSRYGPNRSLDDGVRGFVEAVADDLVDGPAVFEIELLRQPDRRIEDLRLVRIDPVTLDNIRGRTVQYIPSALRADGVHLGLNYVQLDEATLLRIDLDPSARTIIQETFAVLDELDDARMKTAGLMDPLKPTDFDYSAFHAETNLIGLKATRKLGWTGRGLLSDGMLEPYLAWRHLQFLKFKLRMRNTILEGLHQTLSRLGAHLGEQPVLTLAGLTTLDDVVAAEVDLADGRRSPIAILRLGM